eukprot:CAMPEP_0197024112 /NCGR_PEP_ID=MMETSP1384-20130603/4752_1 /TAXON_ID=29189 /ORGANISM="Ammonia sp." /LENGTH=802 /DNA_ID=CAMNT_0042452451 /DNA_START=138 /DNA_END=2546 /DNA_ORIENTATION=+
MQWVDAYIWYIHGKGEDLHTCAWNNWLATRIGLMTIMMEPIFNLFGYMYASRKFVGYTTIFVYLFAFCLMPVFAAKLFATQDPKCGLRSNFCCSTITDTYHVLYAYSQDSNGGFKCWNKYYFFGELQDEIPLLLRVMFLLGIIYPYRWSNPILPGLINALIITTAWFLGYYSDAHASVWCWGASLQSIYLIFLDPLLFPSPTRTQLKQSQFNYHRVDTKEGKLDRKHALNVLQARYSRSRVPKNLDAIVIGSGIGGLTTAALMARAGKKCLVLEQHYRAGGCMHTFDEFGGEFDSGIHYVGAIRNIKLFLSLITSKVIEWYSMGTHSDDVYDTIDLDGIDFKKDVIQYRGGRERLMSELIAKFPKSEQNIKNYFQFLKQTGGRITDLYVLSKLFPHSFLFNTEHWFHQRFIAPYMKYTKMTADEVIKEYIDDPKLRAVIGGGQLIDWCLIPCKASWWVVAAMMNYYIHGAYYPKGGSNNIPLSIIPVIQAAGGAVLCRAKVRQILVNKKTNTAYGVEMDQTGDIIKAPLIVSGVGAHTLFWELLELSTPSAMQKEQELKLLEERKELEPSFGHMTAFITFNGNSQDLELPDYNIHSWGNLAKHDYDINKIQQLFYEDPIKYGDEALICLTFPSAKDPYYDIKFPGKSNALLLTEAKYEWFEAEQVVKNGESNQYGKRTKGYKEFKDSFKEMFMKRLLKYCPKVKDRIIDFEIGTPLSSEHFLNTYKGGSYGISWSTKRFNHEYTKKFFHATAAEINNLYITGESSVFGGFVGALASGYVSAIRILGWKQMLKIVLCTTRVEE